MKINLYNNILNYGKWSYESRYLEANYNGIIGLDEAGRGPLAGPVVCAAAYIPQRLVLTEILVADSKVMTEAQREASYDLIMKNKDILTEVSVVSHTEIDEINILQASLIGMKRACETLLKRIKIIKPSQCIALVDGNKIPLNMSIRAECVIKGDSLVYSIALASIMAKVTRDRIMREYHYKFPQYNFIQHKGYPTFDHRRVLHEIGPCAIHRVSYAPVKLAIQAMNERQQQQNDINKCISASITNSSRSNSIASDERVTQGRKKHVQLKSDHEMIKNNNNTNKKKKLKSKLKIITTKKQVSSVNMKKISTNNNNNKISVVKSKNKNKPLVSQKNNKSNKTVKTSSLVSKLIAYSQLRRSSRLSAK